MSIFSTQEFFVSAFENGTRFGARVRSSFKDVREQDRVLVSPRSSH
jgi:hypothetical protein